MIRLTDKNSQSAIKEINVVKDGIVTPIKKVLVYKVNEGTTDEIYPDSCRNIRIETNYDPLTVSERPVPGQQYPAHVINPAAEGFIPLTITVTPYPPNSGWFIESPTNFNLGVHANKTYYGVQTLNIVIDAPSTVGFNYHEIHATSLKGNNEGRGSNIYRFYVVKYSDSVINYNYDWRFNDSLLDNVTGLELVNVNAAQNNFVATYVPTFSDKGIKAVYDASYTLDPCLYRTTVPLPNWATTGISISWYGYPGTSSRAGFYDLSTTDRFAANDLYIGTSFRLPSNGTISAVSMVPVANVIDRQEPYPKLTHVAVTLTPIDPYNHPNIVVEDLLDPEDVYKIRVTYTSPNVESAVGVPYQVVVNHTKFFKFEDRAYFLVTRYLNGIIKAESFSTLANATLTQPGNGNFEVFFAHNPEQYSIPDILDRITVYEGVVTANDIAAELSSIGLSSAPYVKPVKNEARAQDRVATNYSTVPIKAFLKPFIIDDTTIAVAGSFREWFIERLDIEFPNYGATEQNYRNGFTALWQRNMSNNQIVQLLYKDYQPLILSSWDNVSNFNVQGKTISMIGRWSTAVGLLRFADRYDGTVPIFLEVADIAQYAYFKLSSPMVEGQSYTITWTNNGQVNTTTLTYSRANAASTIKVNQEGYLPEVNKKYAYLGTWLGILASGNTDRRYDPTQNPNFNGTFSIYPRGSNTSVFTGSLTLRSGLVEKYDPGIGLTLNITGENVYKMDFSALTTPGNYQIYVPGVGWSHEFMININAVVKPLYLTARAMFHHRGACDDVKPPYTKWIYGNHGNIAWQAEFPSNESTYTDIKTDSGIDYVTVFPRKGFDIIGATKTGKIFRDATGGWFDAGDFDRRPMHLQCVNDFVNLYLYNPSCFTDNQLDIPESGNGIPDILDEGEWGLDIWRRAQREDGGITLWCEAEFHEAGYAWEIPTHYHLASYNRFDSLLYAASAAKYARALKMVGTELALKKSAIFTESAIRAFNFGVDPAKTLYLSFDQIKNDTVYNFEYTEPEKYYNFATLPAAAALFALTKDPRFAVYINDDTFKWYFYDSLAGNESSYGADACTEMMFDLLDYFPDYCKILRDHMVAKAVTWKSKQEEHPYYAINWSPTRDMKFFYNFVGFGAAHPDRRGRFYIYAWLITGDTGWRDQAALSMDFALGCNPMGRTLSTGIGKVPTLRLLDWWISESEVRDGIYNGPPGFSTYWMTGQAGFASGFTGNTKFVWRLTASARDWFSGVNLNLLPGGYSSTIGNAQNTVGEFIFKNLPMWRQACETEAMLPVTQEYTIWESVTPKMFMWGMLLTEPYVPDPSWHLTEPSIDLNSDPGYLFLP